MKTIRTYPKLCDACIGTGFVPNQNMLTTSSTTMQCPVCKGEGVITVTEIIETETESN